MKKIKLALIMASVLGCVKLATCGTEYIKHEDGTVTISQLLTESELATQVENLKRSLRFVESQLIEHRNTIAELESQQSKLIEEIAKAETVK